MNNPDIYKDISLRTNGSIMLGVVGPVRTGKSTFIKRFMELLVIPHIEDVYARERAKDELPQSGSGKTIMTSEPKFVPEEAVQIRLSDDISFSVRLVDCVGYMVNGAAGQFEDGSERMVATPWYDHEISMTEAAESGTSKVICEHSTIGLVITTDGSICDIPREDYIQPEERVINELKSIGKPFAVLINCKQPNSDSANALREKLSEKYEIPCMCVSCTMLNEDDMNSIMSAVLGEFPISELDIWLPPWIDALDGDVKLKNDVYEGIIEASKGASRISDVTSMISKLNELQTIETASLNSSNLGSGVMNIDVKLPDKLYYELISEEAGCEITNDGELIALLQKMSKIMRDYNHIKKALDDVRQTGYGIVLPEADELEFDEPEIVKHSGKYAVRLKAKAPAIHMLRTGVETEISPSIGGENASEEIISFLLQGYDGDMSKLWESNIFGRPLNEIAEESIIERLNNLPVNSRAKLQETLQRIVNEGRGTLICLLL